MPTFDLLSLHMRIDAPPPDDIDEFLDDVLMQPSTSECEWQIGRPLLHETIHYWQFLGSNYLRGMVDAEWQRLEKFEQAGVVESRSGILSNFHIRNPETGLSAELLMESWARFWEIHLQTPTRLLQQEGFGENDLQWSLLDPTAAGYQPWVAIEIAMSQGVHCQVYGAPFRWLLDQLGVFGEPDRLDCDWFVGRVASKSYVACVVYPALMYMSFQAPDPVVYFEDAVARIATSPDFLVQFCGRDHEWIQLDWMLSWIPLLELLNSPFISPTADIRSEAPSCHEGFIPSEALVNSYGAYVFENVRARPKDMPAYEASLALFSVFGLQAAYAFMGLATFRVLLRRLAGPPIMFFNGQRRVLVPHRADRNDLRLVEDGITAALLSEPRIQRFRRAEKAAELGLPLDAFE